MKKISFLIALILILGFTNQSFAYYEYNLSIPSSCETYIFHNKVTRMSLSYGCEIYYAWHNNFSVKHKFTYDMAKKMLKHPNRIYSIKYEEILASYIHRIRIDKPSYSSWFGFHFWLDYHFWLEKAEIQNFFEYELPKNEYISRLSDYIKIIKDNKNFHNYYVKYLPTILLAKAREKALLAKAKAKAREKALLAKAREKALLGNNRYKAITIINNYCSRHNGCEMEYNDHDVNGYNTYSGSSFTLAGNPISGGNFMITQSLFSTQLQNQLVFMLKQNGFLNASTVNLTSAFVSYITLPGARVFSTIQGLTDMVSSGNLKDFNTLLNLFVKHFIKINR